MQIIINERKIENPLAIFAVVLFALSLVGAVIATVLFVLLPLIGIFISSVLALIIVIFTPILLWFLLPVLFLTIIGYFFGRLFK